MVKTTDREVARGLRAVAWPQDLASHDTKGSSRTVIKTTGHEGGREPLGSSLPRLGNLVPLA
ncbi:hypothetical protein H5410_005136 [Solanum commersonii]|uniref:Uncharacterized protein n=1 Tax=Solanum commersonii TaxID=4109 RepID=A0A9J6A5K9_SOLCO|nr:hypothetical protein H5410_005136 [Solanum commersonii]